MIDLMTLLPILLYISSIILIIILIIIGLRLLKIFDKVDIILDNVEDKVNTLNGLFSVIEKATGGIELISNKIVETIANTIGKLFRKKEEEDENES